MQHKVSKPFFTGIWRLLIVVLVVFSTALTGTASSAGENSAWKMTATGKTSTVCLGDKILFMVRWQPNPTYVNPLSSLTGVDDNEAVVPLTGPRKLLGQSQQRYL